MGNLLVLLARWPAEAFTPGGGTGEALNERILGRPRPSAEQRLEMLEEAVHVINEMLGGATGMEHRPDDGNGG